MTSVVEVDIEVCGNSADEEGIMICDDCAMARKCLRCGATPLGTRCAWSCAECRDKRACGCCNKVLQQGKYRLGPLCDACYDEGHRKCDCRVDASQRHFASHCPPEQAHDAPKFSEPLERRSVGDDARMLPDDWAYRSVEHIVVYNGIPKVEYNLVRDHRIPYAGDGDTVPETQSFEGDFRDESFSSTDLRRSADKVREVGKFVEFVLDGANMEGMDLRGISFVDCRVMRASFNNANLEGADLYRSKLMGSTFKGACLRGARLAGCAIGRADFTGADLSGADLSGCDFRVAKMQGAKTDGAKTYLTVFTNEDADRVTDEIKARKVDDELMQKEEETFRKRMHGLNPSPEADALYVSLTKRRATVTNARAARAQASVRGKPVPPMPSPARPVLPSNLASMNLGAKAARKTVQVTLGDTCPKGHKLQAMKNSSFGCDGCHENCRGCDGWLCMRCNYEVCSKCHDRLLRTSGGKIPGGPACSKGHKMTMTPWSGCSFTCSSCSKYLKSGTPACRCREEGQGPDSYHETWCLSCTECFQEPAPGPKFPAVKQPGPPRCSNGHKLQDRAWCSDVFGCDGPCKERLGTMYLRPCKDCGETWCERCVDKCYDDSIKQVQQQPTTSPRSLPSAPAAANTKDNNSCPKGHKLEPGPGRNFTCDGCRKSCGGQTSMRCKTCDYDLCSSCAPATSPRPSPPPSQSQSQSQAMTSPRCSRGHELKPFQSSGSWTCDGACKQRFGSGVSYHKCQSCGETWCQACVRVTKAASTAKKAPCCSKGHELMPSASSANGFSCDGGCRKAFGSGMPVHKCVKGCGDTFCDACFKKQL